MNVQAKWDEAREVIDASTQDMLAVLAEDDFRAEEKQPELLHKVDLILSPLVDFTYISKVVMGKYYRKASQEERTEFAAAFKITLLKTYVKAMVEFEIESYEIQPPKKKSPNPKKQIVTMRVKAKDGTEFTLVYYMKKTSRGWYLVNVVLDGINLRVTFKNQFADMVQQHKGEVGVAVASWKEKIDSGEQ